MNPLLNMNKKKLQTWANKLAIVAVLTLVLFVLKPFSLVTADAVSSNPVVYDETGKEIGVMVDSVSANMHVWIPSIQALAILDPMTGKLDDSEWNNKIFFKGEKCEGKYFVNYRSYEKIMRIHIRSIKGRMMKPDTYGELLANENVSEIGSVFYKQNDGAWVCDVVGTGFEPMPDPEEDVFVEAKKIANFKIVGPLHLGDY